MPYQVPQFKRRNPLDDARARFMEEPEPEQYFPRNNVPVPGFQRQPSQVAVGRGNTAFDPYISTSAAATFEMEDQDYEFKRDQQETQMDNNALSRLENRSKMRLMPHSEAAERAGYDAARVKNESSVKLNPFIEDMEREQAQTATESSRFQRKAMPEVDQLATTKRRMEMDAMESEDVGLRQLAQITKEPAHHAAYEFFRDSAPPDLKKPAERQQYAFKQARRMAQDQEAVDAITREAAETDNPAYWQMVEPVEDANGDFYGYRLKSGLKPVERANIAMTIAKQRRKKEELAESREARYRGESESREESRSLDAAIKDLEDIVKEDTTNEEAKKDLMELRQERIRRFKGGKSGAAPSGQAKAASPSSIDFTAPPAK